MEEEKKNDRKKLKLKLELQLLNVLPFIWFNFLWSKKKTHRYCLAVNFFYTFFFFLFIENSLVHIYTYFDDDDGDKCTYNVYLKKKRQIFSAMQTFFRLKTNTVFQKATEIKNVYTTEFGWMMAINLMPCCYKNNNINNCFKTKMLRW